MEEYMAYFVVSSVEWLCGRIYDVFYSEKCGVAVWKNIEYILCGAV